MLFPENRYRFSYKKNDQKKTTLSVILIGLVFFAAIFLVLFLTGVLGPKKENTAFTPAQASSQESLEELWEKGNYESLNTRCEEILNRSPLNLEALIYNGFSYFYRGVGQFSLEDRLPLIDLAVINLRKALTADKNPLTGSLQFILGKAYYLKGKSYYDLSVKYLEESLISGYAGEDTYEYLGMAYAGLNMYEKSAENYEKALDQKGSDTISLALAQTYMQMGETPRAEESLNRALWNTTDHNVEEKSRFLLARILTERNELEQAESQYLAILEENANSADAHYFLGEIYETQGNRTKARYEWRKAVEIDPSHYGARLKLY